MSYALPLVSVVVPTLDEELDIAGCLASIAAQSYPREHIEVLVVDGGSTDATVATARAAAAHHHLNLRVLSNVQRVQSAGLNVALAASTSDFLVRVDARSLPAANHVDRCVAVLRERPDVGAVGGAQIAHARSDGLVDRAIARALNNRYAMGLARYRRRASSGPTDTVWMGAFRTSDLRTVGGWDDTFVKNEDFELNQRLRNSGSVVWFDAALSSRYLPRRSARAVMRQYIGYGTTKGAMWATKWRPNARQIVLLVAPVVVVGAIAGGAYFVGWMPVSVACVAAAALLDAAGNRGEPASIAERGCAAVINCAIGGSWWLGVVGGWGSALVQRRAAPSTATTVAAIPHSDPADVELARSHR